MTISEKAVEAAARAIYESEHRGRPLSFEKELDYVRRHYRDGARAALAAALPELTLHESQPKGWKLVPIEATDAMCEIALDITGERVTAYTAPRESGVAVECDLTEEDAAAINKELKGCHAEVYSAMVSAAPQHIADQEEPKP